MRLINILLKTIIVLLVLLVIVYFVITSGFFIRKVILPIVGHQIKGTITVDSIRFAPLKGEVAFSNLLLQTDECSAKIKKFDCGFSLFALFSDKVKVKHFELEDSYISLISRVAQTTPSSQQDSPSSETKLKMYALDIKNVKVLNFNLKYSVIRDNASSDTVTEIKNFNLSAPYFETSGKAFAEFSSDIATSTSSDTLSGSIKGKLNAVLNSKTFPKELIFQSSLNLGKDSSPIYVKFDSTEEEGRMPFDMSASISNLPLQPFFQTFLSGNYKKTDGYINSFDLKANGTDIAQVNSLDGVDGNINLTVSNVYVPVGLDKNPIVELLLLPLDAISTLDNSVASKVFSGKNSDVMNNSSRALSGQNIIEFQKGDISAIMKDGNVDIKKFIFTGSSKSAIKMMDISGVINKDQTIDLNTKTSISGLIIPLHITGTIKDPKPDTVNLVNSMIKNTASTISNIIDAAGNNSSSNNTTKSILNAVDSLTGGSSSDDSSDNSVGNLINNIKSFSK